MLQSVESQLSIFCSLAETGEFSDQNGVQARFSDCNVYVPQTNKQRCCCSQRHCRPSAAGQMRQTHIQSLLFLR